MEGELMSNIGKCSGGSVRLYVLNLVDDVNKLIYFIN